jgi:hypothetical protein
MNRTKIARGAGAPATSSEGDTDVSDETTVKESTVCPTCHKESCPECDGFVLDGVCKGCGWKRKVKKDDEGESEKPNEPVGKGEEMETRILKTSDDEKRLVTGIVLKPEERDAQKHIYNEDVVEETAHDFVARYNEETELGKEHSKFFKGQNLQLVESLIVPDDMEMYGRQLKKGTWIITVKVNDDDLWEEVKSGVVKGFSVGGRAVMSEG